MSLIRLEQIDFGTTSRNVLLAIVNGRLTVVDSSQESAAPAAGVPPDPATATGKTMFDTTSGRLVYSNGTEWIPLRSTPFVPYARAVYTVPTQSYPFSSDLSLSVVYEDPLFSYNPTTKRVTVGAACIVTAYAMVPIQAPQPWPSLWLTRTDGTEVLRTRAPSRPLSFCGTMQAPAGETYRLFTNSGDPVSVPEPGIFILIAES